ncbi:hypothetical protein F7734_24455 [Scytonema sp. UIC 10036]|uniref:hypothetical protein n=1 Tax=Scytonema sp. UIC 10036 TaxID=2304196 RepID=UPI0012DA77A1|nr:hypothetical protein [Scytonema sp. UIC 10036]MUG95345.1 hypothetical protein [Scytonema sp. UIC 10036]
MTKRLTLHLQQNTTLERVAVILDNFSSRQTDIDQLAALCQLGATVLQKNVFPFLRNLSILDKKNPSSLTPLGKVAADIQQSNPDLLGDFLHLVIYQLHLFEHDKRFSWAYATVVRQLWLRKEVVLSSAEKKSIVGEVIEKAAVNFEIPASEIAFSDSSITGVLNWLRSLSPRIIRSEGKSEYFTRRYFCAAPIFLKAVDAIYKQRQRTYGTKIFLREDIKDAICQMLLLDPSGLDGTLNNAKCTYDYEQGGFFDWGYEGGYGQWIMLTKSPEWSQLI